MKKSIFTFLMTVFTTVLIAQKPSGKSDVASIVADKVASFAPGSVRIHGYTGAKIDLVISDRIKKENADDLVEPFRKKNETHLWQSEFWGKWILSAIASYDYNRDPEMLAIIRKAAHDLIATQMPSGYIGNYSDSAQLNNGISGEENIHCSDLLSYYDLTGEKEVLKSACKLADHLLSQIGPGKVNIVKTGNYRGMPSSSILEPMIYSLQEDRR